MASCLLFTVGPGIFSAVAGSAGEVGRSSGAYDAQRRGAHSEAQHCNSGLKLYRCRRACAARTVRKKTGKDRKEAAWPRGALRGPLRVAIFSGWRLQGTMRLSRIGGTAGS